MFSTDGFSVLFVVFSHLIRLGSFCDSDQDQCRELLFDPDKAFSGQRLINHLIRVTDVKSEAFCQMLCYLEPDCVSYNFQMESGEPESHQCELNNSTHQDHTNNLRLNPAYEYHGAENACVRNLCKNKGTCQTGFTDRGYRCLCATGFGGHNCEERVGTSSQENDYTLLFPHRGTEDYVITHGMPELTALTVCLWMRTNDTQNKGTPLSYNLQAGGDKEELVLWDYKDFEFIIGGKGRRTGVSAIDGLWHHICVTWDNSDGYWRLYKDGKKEKDGKFKKGHVIRTGGALVLGQEQDSFEGSFDAKQCFIGEMTGVNIWDHVKDEKEIQWMSKSCSIGLGNVFRWAHFKSHLRGSLKVTPLPTC
ncbi:C-reactive protein-like [Montipora foliosa]|uniref:C-reactive protein-like n=1 Tax=Montipora foliosa TaxID=591990 RepID=UPI0035F1E44B